MKKCGDSIGAGTLITFNQTLENCRKISVGNDIYNLTKNDEIQVTDTTESKFPNIGTDLLQKWNIKCNNKNNDSKVETFIKSTITNSPTVPSGAISLPPIGNSFIYIETSSNNNGNDKIFVPFARKDKIQISNNTFYYNRYSILNIEAIKSRSRFENQLLLEDTTPSTQYNKLKKD